MCWTCPSCGRAVQRGLCRWDRRRRLEGRTPQVPICHWASQSWSRWWQRWWPYRYYFEAKVQFNLPMVSIMCKGREGSSMAMPMLAKVIAPAQWLLSWSMIVMITDDCYYVNYVGKSYCYWSMFVVKNIWLQLVHLHRSECRDLIWELWDSELDRRSSSPLAEIEALSSCRS